MQLLTVRNRTLLLLASIVWLIAGIACLCLIYGILLPLLGCITRDDLHRSVSH